MTTKFIQELNNDQIELIEDTLMEQGFEGDTLRRALNSRICDLNDSIDDYKTLVNEIKKLDKVNIKFYKSDTLVILIDQDCTIYRINNVDVRNGGSDVLNYLNDIMVKEIELLGLNEVLNNFIDYILGFETLEQLGYSVIA